MFTVYMHISPSKKYYIGITSTPVYHRWGKQGCNYKKQSYFWRAIQKYGWDNFEHIIVATNLTKEEACRLEIELIQKYQSNNSSFGYNVSMGGECTFYGVKRSPDWCKKISKALKGNRNRVHKLSDREKSLIRDRMRGNNYGSHRSITDEYKKKALESQPNRCVIEQYTLDGQLIATYRSINEAQRLTGIYNIAEASKPNGLCKTAGGYVWSRKGN